MVGDRIAKVEARCTSTALAFLRELRDCPFFDDLIARLDGIPDTISQADVEDAYEALLKETQKK